MVLGVRERWTAVSLTSEDDFPELYWPRVHTLIECINPAVVPGSKETKLFEEVDALHELFLVIITKNLLVGVLAQRNNQTSFSADNTRRASSIIHQSNLSKCFADSKSLYYVKSLVQTHCTFDYLAVAQRVNWNVFLIFLHCLISLFCKQWITNQSRCRLAVESSFLLVESSS